MKRLSKHFNSYAQKGWPWPKTDSTIYLLHQLFLQVGWPTVLAAFLLLPTRVPSKRLRFCLRHHSNFSPKYSLIVKYFKPSHTFINTFSMVLSKTKHITGQLGCKNTSMWWTILLVRGKCHKLYLAYE